MHALEIHLTSRPGQLIARLVGDVDFATCDRLDQLEALAGVDRLTVDLREVEFIDTAGTAALQDLAERLQDHGGELLVAGASRQVRHLLGRCGGDGLATTVTAERPAAPGRFERLAS